MVHRFTQGYTGVQRSAHAETLVSEYFRVFPGISEYFRAFPSIAEYLCVFPNELRDIVISRGRGRGSGTIQIDLVSFFGRISGGKALVRVFISI